MSEKSGNETMFGKGRRFQTTDVSGKLPPRAEPRDPEKLHACILVLEGWDTGREHLIEGDTHTIGRGMESDTVCQSPSVSRSHARIYRVGEGPDLHWEIEDLDSRNGSFVNGEKVRRVILAHGDKLQLGSVLFRFSLMDDADLRFHQKLHRRLHYHSLTGLLTVQSFHNRFRQFIGEMQEDDVLTLAMTDMDGLKKVNDTWGHKAGNEVITAMGEVIRGLLHEEDFAGIFGGDETMILFADTTIEEAIGRAEELRNAMVDRVFRFEGEEVRVSISQGLAQWPDHGLDPDTLFAAADHALYAAKAAGRNCIRLAGNREE